MTFKINIYGAATVTFSLLLTINGEGSSSAVTPAQAAVTSPSTPLLDSDTLQLNDAVFNRIVNDSITSKYADMFDFETNRTLEKRQFSTCKTYPGDLLWPSKVVWGIFDLLLGQRLLATEPIASPCYDSAWGTKYLAKCNELIGRFTKATTQCVCWFPLHRQFTDV